MTTGWRSAVALVALAGCTATRPAMPAGAVVLPGDAATRLARQCSRASPAGFEATWQPATADIAALEKALPEALATDDRSGWRAASGDWRRQYVGLVRQGVRTIYGNFIPATAAERGGWRDRPAIICDGGPGFFGVEYDPAAKRFVSIAHNGPY